MLSAVASAHDEQNNIEYASGDILKLEGIKSATECCEICCRISTATGVPAVKPDSYSYGTNRCTDSYEICTCKTYALTHAIYHSKMVSGKCGEMRLLEDKQTKFDAGMRHSMSTESNGLNSGLVMGMAPMAMLVGIVIAGVAMFARRARATVHVAAGMLGEEGDDSSTVEGSQYITPRQ